jgi:DtxR family transcriptional regulator, Mn-dependent transcriptional regulator
MPELVHSSVEEYLEAMYGLDEEGVAVIQARLVERLGYSPQAVSEMVRRLTDEGYLTRVGRGVSFTERGREQATTVVRRHRLAERFLVDIVGLPWHKAHTEAGLWEHVISPDVEERFIALLGNPATCPHGSPIPGGPIVTIPQRQLADAPAGARVHLARITEQIETDPQALVYLSEHGIIPGRDAEVKERAPDGTMILVLDGAPSGVAVGAEMSRQIYIDVD